VDYQSRMPSDRLSKDLAYIKGLMEGHGTMDTTPEGKVLHQMVRLMDQMAEEHERMNVRLAELEEYVEAVDEDLNEMELLVYDEVDENEEEDIGFWQVKCPECGDSMLVDEEIFDSGSAEDVECPQCQTVMTISDEGGVSKRDLPHHQRAFLDQNEPMVEQ